jgi:hypothetical protein
MLLAFPADIRLGWKGLLGTNALAYYNFFKLTVIKSFITLILGAKGQKLLFFATVGQTNKLECLSLEILGAKLIFEERKSYSTG